MPSAKPAPSSTASSNPSSSTIPPNLATLFSTITPQHLSTLSTQLGMTADEHSRVSTAMRDPAFLALLADYAREMSDPEVKRQQDEVLRKMEQEAGLSGGGKGKAKANGGVGEKRAAKAERPQARKLTELDLD